MQQVSVIRSIVFIDKKKIHKVMMEYTANAMSLSSMTATVSSNGVACPKLFWDRLEPSQKMLW